MRSLLVNLFLLSETDTTTKLNGWQKICNFASENGAGIALITFGVVILGFGFWAFRNHIKKNYQPRHYKK